MPEDIPEDMPDRMPDRMPEDMSEYMPEDMSDRMPDRMPEDMSDRMPEDMPDRMPEDLPDRMPEDMPEDMPDRMPNRMSEDMSDRMPEDMPDRMPNRMSEDMSDRMPEDVPVRTCINVMVGITRSKVIMVFWVPHQQWIKQNNHAWIPRGSSVDVPVTWMLNTCSSTAPFFYVRDPGIPFDGPIKPNFPKVFQKLPILLGFLIGRFRSFRTMEVQSGSPRPLDASRQQKTNLHLVDVQQFL